METFQNTLTLSTHPTLTKRESAILFCLSSEKAINKPLDVDEQLPYLISVTHNNIVS